MISVRIIAVTIAAMILPFTVSGQGLSTEENLRRENRRLKEKVNELERRLYTYEGAPIVNTWENLTNVDEEDGEIVFGLGGIKSSPNENADLLMKMKAALPCFESVAWDDCLEGYAELYASKLRGRMPAAFGRYAARLPYMEKAFEKAGVPKELAALCIVESQAGDRALSQAGALGLWQFMPTTARDYGMTVNENVDERLDWKRSTDCAARYLAAMKKNLGSWPLAVAAYNCGPGPVKSAIVKSGGSRDPWTIAQYLPKETQGYLPSLLAAAYVWNCREELGLVPKDTPPPFEGVPYHVKNPISMQMLSAALGVDEKMMRRASPWIVGDEIPAGTKLLLNRSKADEAKEMEL